MHDTILQDEVRRFASQFPLQTSVAVTLTLKSCMIGFSQKGTLQTVPLTEEAASKNFRHFMNLLNSRVFSKGARRGGRRLKALPVIEGGRDSRLHIHALIETPPAELGLPFPLAIEQAWHKTDWGNRRIDIAEKPDSGWLTYMTKFRSKQDYASSIDWMNVSI